MSGNDAPSTIEILAPSEDKTVFSLLLVRVDALSASVMVVVFASVYDLVEPNVELEPEVALEALALISPANSPSG